jgi:hypothetical protein
VFGDWRKELSQLLVCDGIIEVSDADLRVNEKTERSIAE